jgi:hypothetical protein
VGLLLSSEVWDSLWPGDDNTVLDNPDKLIVEDQITVPSSLCYTNNKVDGVVCSNYLEREVIKTQFMIEKRICFS